MNNKLWPTQTQQTNATFLHHSHHFMEGRQCLLEAGPVSSSSAASVKN